MGLPSKGRLQGRSIRFPGTKRLGPRKTHAHYHPFKTTAQLSQTFEKEECRTGVCGEKPTAWI